MVTSEFFCLICIHSFTAITRLVDTAFINLAHWDNTYRVSEVSALEALEAKLFKRTVLLNALPLNIIPEHVYFFDIACKRSGVDAIADIIRQSLKVENYIRHESTVKLLSKLFNIDLKPSSELYKYQSGDVLVIVTLRKPVRGQEVEVREEDLDFYLCTISTIMERA